MRHGAVLIGQQGNLTRTASLSQKSHRNFALYFPLLTQKSDFCPISND